MTLTVAQLAAARGDRVRHRRVRPRARTRAGRGGGVLVVGYLLHGIAPMSDALEPPANLSPWEWALGSDPLVADWEARRTAS
ncbi:hypothetical protein LUR56_18290 [Streptomyces sp. MT29]|nr:hypothetical protein [Streptomyces sp. MT29]